MSFGKRVPRTALIIGGGLILAGGALYAYITSGGLIARQKPLAAEAVVMRELLELSLPKSAKTQKNPLLADTHGADINAGADLYKRDCDVCHGYFSDCCCRS